MGATTTRYVFDCGPASLTVDFSSPVVADDLELVSRPASYVRFYAASKDGKSHSVQVYFDASAEWAVHDPKQAVTWDRPKIEGLQAVRVGTVDQKVLGLAQDLKPADVVRPA